jgi:hypothetical protein
MKDQNYVKTEEMQSVVPADFPVLYFIATQ